MNKPALLPCPFCGNQPEIMNIGDARKGLMLECITDGCVKPHVSCHRHDRAIKKWNTRNGNFFNVSIKKYEPM